jgi:hypothetical protein
VRRSRCTLVASLAAVALGGCGQDLERGEPPAPPTTAELSRLVAETRQPGYWLGPRFRDITVSHASVIEDQVRLTYGPWTCDTGCVDEGGVWTGRRAIDAVSDFDFADTGIDTRDCWRRVGRAVAVLTGCDPGGYPQELVIYTGSREIVVTSLYTRDGQDEVPVRMVVRRLRPLNERAPWPLRRPEPLSCRDFERVDVLYRRHMPRALRPVADC